MSLTPNWTFSTQDVLPGSITWHYSKLELSELDNVKRLQVVWVTCVMKRWTQTDAVASRKSLGNSAKQHLGALLKCLIKLLIVPRGYMRTKRDLFFNSAPCYFRRRQNKLLNIIIVPFTPRHNIFVFLQKLLNCVFSWTIVSSCHCS